MPIGYPWGRIAFDDGSGVYTTAAFTVPSVGAAVNVSVVNAQLTVVGEYVFIESAGYYTVNSISLPAGTINVTNTGYPSNAAPATVIPSGRRINSAGPRGNKGSTGSSDAYGPAFYQSTSGVAAHWRLNGNLSDSGPSGLTLTAHGGSEEYSQLGNTQLVGFWFNGSTGLKRTVHDAALTITGSLTVDMLLLLPPFTNLARTFVYFGLNAEAESDNVLYGFSQDANGFCTYFAEQGAGGNISYAVSPLFGLPAGKPFHFAITRSSGQILKWYVNGDLWHTSPVQTAPTGGSTALLQIGMDHAFG